jgi:hypothetical protein
MIQAVTWTSVDRLKNVTTNDLPRCPEHRNLARDLALGFLEGECAVEAERLRHECDHCRAWWTSALPADLVQPVDASVELAFRTVSLPVARRRTGWRLVAAATVALAAVGLGGLVGLSQKTSEMTRATSQPMVVMDFEDSVARPADATAAGELPLFVSGLEDGTLGGWS